jgi:hypothetical protein
LTLERPCRSLNQELNQDDVDGICCLHLVVEVAGWCASLMDHKESVQLLLRRLNSVDLSIYLSRIPKRLCGAIGMCGMISIKCT